MKRSHKIAIGIVAAAALGLTGAALYAQPAGEGWGPGMMGYGGPGMMGGWHGGPGMMGGRFGANPAAAIDSHLGALKSELKITSAQESAWQKFADAAKQHGEAAGKLRDQQFQNAPQTAPERMAQRTEIMKQQLAGMESTTGAFKQLYAALTPAQKAVADREFGPFRGPRFGGGYQR
jgi:LTXXQ motif family protein